MFACYVYYTDKARMRQEMTLDGSRFLKFVTIVA